MTEKVLMKGNEAMAESAMRAGCRFFFGYPITPQTELAAYMSKRMPKIGGTYLQAESEIAAGKVTVNGKAAQFSDEELSTLKSALSDMSQKLGSMSVSI